MSGVNKVILIGNLGSDPEVKVIEGGTKVANFNLATTEYYIDKEGQKRKETNWHKVVAWSGIAELVEKLLVKGDRVYIEGRLKNRNYEDASGKKRISEIVILNFLKL